MKITNFNPVVNKNGNFIYTWNVWRRTYIKDLEHSINSLYDYLLYSSPEWDVLNARDKMSSEDLQTNGYCHLNAKLSNGKTGTAKKEKIISLFFVDKLDYRQGMINMGQDALGVYKTSDNKYYILGASSSDYLTEAHEEGSGDLYYKTNNDNIFNIVNFQSGLLVFNNNLNVGKNDRYNEERHNPNNYFNLPIGNGGFYMAQNGYKKLTYTFIENDIGNFSDTIDFLFLVSSLRYNYLKYTAGEGYNQFFYWSSSYVETSFQSDDIYSVGKKNNTLKTYRWDGSKYILSSLSYKSTDDYNTTEEVVADTVFYTNKIVEDGRANYDYHIRYTGKKTNNIFPSNWAIVQFL